MQGDEEFGTVASKVLGELRVVKVKKACAQAPRLAVDHVEDFHLFALSQSDKAHEWKLQLHVAEMAQPVLAIHLREHKGCVLCDLQPRAAFAGLDDAPRPVVTGAQIERQWNGRAVCLLN